MGHEQVLTGGDIEDPSEDAESNVSIGDVLHYPQGCGEGEGLHKQE